MAALCTACAAAPGHGGPGAGHGGGHSGRGERGAAGAKGAVLSVELELERPDFEQALREVSRHRSPPRCSNACMRGRAHVPSSPRVSEYLE